MSLVSLVPMISFKFILLPLTFFNYRHDSCSILSSYSLVFLLFIGKNLNIIIQLIKQNIKYIMYYVNQQSIQASTPSKTSQLLLINILTIPPEERSLNDHQIIYGFFHRNDKLQEIQRIKSLNTKLKCIANLMVDTKGRDGNFLGRAKDQKMIVISQIMGMDDKKYYVLLKESKKEQLMKSDEKYLRHNIEVLKKYMILKDMKYFQLLHLAYYMDELSFKYKEYVYQEGDEPNSIYLVQKGEFHYGKSYAEEGYVPKQKKSKKQRPKRYNVNISTFSNPNRLRNPINVQLKIGVIEGGNGQSFGEQEILTSSRRQYSVKCMSTQNLVIRIPKDKYKNVLSSAMTRIQWMKKQSLKRNEIKDEMLNKIISIKKQYKRYVQLLSKSKLNRTEQMRFENQLNSTQLVGLEKNKSKEKLPKIRAQSMASQQLIDLYSENSHRKVNKSLDKSQLGSEQEKSQNLHLSKKFESGDQSQNSQNIFDRAIQNRKRKLTKENQDSSRQYLTSSQNGIPANPSNTNLLPTLKSQKYQSRSAHETVQSLVAKNWSASRPILQLKGLRSKFSGMIDSNQLVKQKQSILNTKLKMKKDVRDELFPVEQVDKKVKEYSKIITKQESRQMRSAAHSKAFMHKLLISSLQKAGYDSENNEKQKQKGKEKEASIDIKNNLRIPKLKSKNQKERQRQKSQVLLLEDNAFDQCYFKKI